MMISRLGVRKNLRIHKLVYCHVRYMATHTSTALILALVPFLVGSFYMSTLCHYDQPKRIIEFFEEDVDVNTNLPDASMTAILDEIPEKYPNRPIWYTGVPALYTQPIVLIGHPGFNDVCDCMDYAVDVFRNQFIPYIRIFDEMIRDSSDMDVCFRPAPEISFFRQLCQVYRTMNTTVQYPVGLIIGQTHNLIQFGAGAFERFLEMYDFGFTKSATGSVKDLKLAHVFFSDPKPIHHFPLVVLYGLGLVYAYQAIKSIAPKKNCVSITLSSAFQLIVSVYYAYRIEQYLNSSSGYDPMSSALFVAVLIGLESTVGIVEATISATRLVPPPALPDSIAYGYAQSTDKFLYQFTAIVCVAGIGASCPILKLRSFSTCLLLAMCIQTILQLTSFIAVLSVELSGLYEKLNLYRATTALSFVLGICIVSIPSQSSIVTKENEYSWVINTLRIDHRSNLNHRYFTIFKQPTLLVEAKMCESRNDRENQEVPKLMSTAKRSNENAVNLIVPLVIVATTLTFLTTTLFVSNFVVDSEDHPINDKHFKSNVFPIGGHVQVLGLHEHNLFGFDLNTRRLFVASVDRLDICLHFLFRRIDEAGKCLSFCCNGIEAVFGFRCGHMFTYRLLEHDPRDPKGLRRRWTRICESIPIIGLQQLNQKQGFIGYNVLGDVFVVSGSTLTWLDRQSNQGLIAWNRDCCNSYEIAMVTIRAELKVVCPRDLKTRCVKFNAHDVSQISCSKKILDPKVPRRLLCLFLDGTVRAYDLYHGNDTELVLEPKYQCRFLGHCRRLLGSKSDWFILGAGDRLYKLNQNQLDLFDNDVIDAHGSSNGTICVLTFENLKILNDGLLKVEPIKSLKKPAEITIGIDCKTVAVIDSSHVHAMNI